MDFSTLTVGESVSDETEDIKITFTRTDADTIQFEQFAPEDGRLVLRGTKSVSGPAADITYVDRSFWNVTLDGKPIPPGQDVSGSKMSANTKTRTISYQS